MILYYPAMGLIIWLSNHLTKRHGENRRRDMAFGCAFMALVGAPIIIQIGWLIYQAVK